MILSKKAGYVKDMDLFINSLGGVDGEDLDENDIKYADGGMMADGGMAEGYHQMPDGSTMANSAHMANGGYMADGGKTKKWSDIKKGKIEDLKSEIEYLDKYLKNLENENTKESYEASNKLRNYKATLQAKILNLEDEEYAKGGYMAKGGKILSAINRDRAYKSQESWEQNYVRKNRPKNPKYKSSSNIFEEGGMMADGGEVGRGFYIREMREKLNRMFPDTFGFTVGNVSKEGNKILNSSALIVDLNDPYRGLEDKDIESKLFFSQYKRDHNINFRVMQGGENTYFYFALESEKGDEYIGQFGFKDMGDVSSDYITRFIAFLMEQYGLPFQVNHSVMAHGGELHRTQE